MPISSTMASTILATVLKPVMYLAAPSDTPRITGDFICSAAWRIDLVHSKLLILKWPIAYLPSTALFIISFAFDNITIFLS